MYLHMEILKLDMLKYGMLLDIVFMVTRGIVEIFAVKYLKIITIHFL